MSRKPIIAGNWKMNLLQADAKALYEGIKSFVDKFDAPQLPTVIIAPVFTSLNQVAEIPCNCGCGESKLYVAAQNCHWEKSGAFTGELSVEMLKDAGCSYVIIGHSERRQYFGETDITVNKRLLAGLEAGLKVILCVGETLEEREQGITEEIVAKQVKVALLGTCEKCIKNVVIAYEPVWAIGTGKTATAEQAEEVCAFIRKTVEGLFNKEIADGMTIQYGGSMNEKNCAELLSKEDIDGGLIGGASLVAEKFGVLLEEASK